MFEEYVRYMSIPVNKILLDCYSALGLDESGFVVLVKLIDIRHRTSQLPEFSHLAKGTTMTEAQISKMIQELMQKDLLEVETIKEDGKYIERFNLDPLYRKLSRLLESSEPEQVEPSEIRSLFEYVEGLYGRVISPNEFERINSWLEDSKYTPQVIKEAIDLAYQNQITSLQYVERILNQTGGGEPTGKGERMPVRSWLEGEDVFDQ